MSEYHKNVLKYVKEIDIERVYDIIHKQHIMYLKDLRLQFTNIKKRYFDSILNELIIQKRITKKPDLLFMSKVILLCNCLGF